MRTYKDVMEKFYSHLTKDDLAHEEWLPAIIDGVESDRYLVSNLGRFADRRPKVKHSDAGRFQDVPGFGPCQLLNIRPAATTSSKHHAEDGYLDVWLNGKHRWTHTVIASTFIREIPADFTVDHITEHNAYDNRVENLQILSRHDNSLKGKILRSYETGVPVGLSWHTQRRKWRVYAPWDVFGIKRHVAYFNRFESAAVCVATIYRRYCRCDSENIREMLLQSYADLADYKLTDAEQADVNAKIAAFEDQNADIIKEIGVLADAQRR